MKTTVSHIKNGELNLTQSEILKEIVANLETDYTFIYLHSNPIEWGEYAIERMLQVALDTNAGMVYSDRYKIKNGKTEIHPVLDYQEGSLRDDFDFGAVLLYKTSVLKQAISRIDKKYQYAVLYAVRLLVSQLAKIVHLNEYLYCEMEKDFRLSGEKQFDYVDPKNREVQIEMEAVCTSHLADLGAKLNPVFKAVDFADTSFPVEASVIIPVRNREKTIEEAVQSALMQKTNFPFNVIVVDNHSTDNTTSILRKLASEDKRLIHITPKRSDLGIGGCWNEAIMSLHCGKFAVQLDSDDLYWGEQVLAKIVQAFYEQKTAMIIGAYKMVNFKLEEIPPGIIEHREWTPENGRNNALRINGLGAPRAFYTPIIREIKFPNTSYGEDYAVGLAISRNYQIGRIYEPLYLCRRWDENSDASLDVNKLNAYNHYKDSLRTQELWARKPLNPLKGTFADARHLGNRAYAKSPSGDLGVIDIDNLFQNQLQSWNLAKEKYTALSKVITKNFHWNDLEVKLQFNPDRIHSAVAKVGKTEIEKRPCFLCEENRPKEQIGIPFRDDYSILVNPYPIFPVHLTIAANKEIPQLIKGRIDDFLDLASELPDFSILYNGPKSGASAPNHFHFQAGNKGFLPIEEDAKNEQLKVILKTETEGTIAYLKNYLRKALLLESADKSWLIRQFYVIYDLLHAIQPTEEEPMFNLICWKEKARWILVIFPRKQHRPKQFFASDETQIVISPGVVDVGGVLITVRKEDFDKINNAVIEDIFKQITLSDEKFESLISQIKNK